MPPISSFLYFQRDDHFHPNQGTASSTFFSQSELLLCFSRNYPSPLPVSFHPPPPFPFLSLFLSFPPNQPNLSYPNPTHHLPSPIVLTFLLDTLDTLFSSTDLPLDVAHEFFSRPLSVASNLISHPTRFHLDLCLPISTQTHLPVRSASGPVFTLTELPSNNSSFRSSTGPGSYLKRNTDFSSGVHR